jgi:hypothetical protein
MRCETVRGHLSCFVDGMLERDVASDVSLHLQACTDCDLEFTRLQRLQQALRNFHPVEAPVYLRSLVEMKIENARRHSWRRDLRHAWEYRLSKIRSTEGIWYLTRLVGAMATFVLFIAISSSMNPILGFNVSLSDRGSLSQALRSLQLGIGVQRNLGMTPMDTPKKTIRSSDPKINDQYLANLGENAARGAQDDTVSVVAVVDRSGTAKVENILDYPADDSLLNEFTDMIMSAGWRPASQNGKAVDQRLVLTFSRVNVYN